MPASRPDSVLGLEKVSRPQWHLRGMRKAPVSSTPSLPRRERPGVALTPPLPRWAGGRGGRGEPGLSEASRAHRGTQTGTSGCGKPRAEGSGVSPRARPPRDLGHRSFCVPHPQRLVFHFLPLPFRPHLEGESERQRRRQSGRECHVTERTSHSHNSLERMMD